MSPDEAKKKWCPWSRTLSMQDEGPAINRPGPTMSSQQTANVIVATRCLADGCMLWTTSTMTEWDGWCSLSSASNTDLP
jgi:hypothetical protein